MDNSKRHHTHERLARTSEQQRTVPTLRHSSRESQLFHPIHRLQQAAGNQFVTTYLQQRDAKTGLSQLKFSSPSLLSNRGLQERPLSPSARIAIEQAISGSLDFLPTFEAGVESNDELELTPKVELETIEAIEEIETDEETNVEDEVESVETEIELASEREPETIEVDDLIEEEVVEEDELETVETEVGSELTAEAELTTIEAAIEEVAVLEETEAELELTAATESEAIEGTAATELERTEAEQAELEPAVIEREVQEEAPTAQFEAETVAVVPPSEEVLPPLPIEQPLESIVATGAEAVEAELEPVAVTLPEEPATETEAGETEEISELRTWRSQVSGATSAIPEPSLSEATTQGTGQVQQQGGTLRTERQAARQTIPQQARRAVSPPPQPEQPLPPPEPDPVPEATRLVEEKSNRRLPDQTMPDLQQSPRGTLPQIGQRLEAPTAQLEAGEDVVEVLERESTEQPTPEQSQTDELQQESTEMPDTDRAGTGEGVTLTDRPPPPSQPLPPVAQSAIASVLAQLLANPEAEAEAILMAARKAAYPNEKLQQVYPDLGNDELTGLTESLTSELQTIAQEAGIANDELSTKIRERQQELEQQREQATDSIETTASEEETGLAEEGQTEQDAIAGAREALDENRERQLEAASGTADPSVIRAKKERLQRQINHRVGQQRVAYEQARQRREQQLDTAGSAQIQAYRVTSQADERAILAAAEGESPTPLRTNLEAAAIRTWAREREREIQHTVFTMKQQAQQWADGYRTDIQNAGDRANELIQAWADEQTGEQRSWWDRLLDLFRGWGEQAQAEAEAWETARAGETRDAILTDFAVLNQFSARAGDQVDLSSADALRGLSEEQQAVIRAYYSTGPEARNPITAVAAGLRMRLSLQRRPQLIQRFETALESKSDSEWENLDLLGKAQQGGFSADRLRNDLYQAMHGGITGWGTDEARIFQALSSLTKVQSLAVRKCYSATHGRSLDADLESELSGAELTRAQAQLSGDQILADVATLREAMHGGITGLGTDEDVIMNTLRGKSEEERQRIIAEYQRQYNVDLSAELRDELSSHDLDRANALMEGDVARADAIAIDQAMRGGIFGWGTDEAAIEGVYQQVRQDVAAEATRQGWTTEQMEAEIARRSLEVESSYNAQYGEDWTPGDESALRQAFRSELSGPELDLANALADNDLIRADAARIAIEAQGVVYTDDDVVNGVLQRQYERSLEELRRDEWPAIQRDLDRRAREEGWDPYRRRAEERRLERELEQRAQTRSRGYMQQLEESYDQRYDTWGRNGLSDVIDRNLSGHDREKAQDLLAQGGYLSPAQQIHYAVEGAGTEEEALRQALAGRSPAEIAEIRQEWARLHPDENMDERIRSELSGRDEFDTNLLLEGEPENAKQEMDQMRRRADWELENSSGFLSGEERRILQDRRQSLEEQYAVVTDPTVTGAERQLALERFQQRSGNVGVAIEGYREQLDSVTDTLASAAAITAAIAVIVVASIFTGGAAAGAIPALISALSSGGVAAASAGAAALATVITKGIMLGGAYGGEDIGIDLAVGAVDALASYATAGVGAGLLKAARGGNLARMAASPSRLTRVLAHGIAEGAEGVISSLPAAVTGNLLNDQNWEQGNPFTNIALGTLVETGMGTVMSAGLGSLGGLKNIAQPDVRPTRDILAHRGTPQERLTQWRAYKAEHPDATMRDFLRQYDEGVALRLEAGDAQQQLQRQLRGELLSGIPPAQRGPVAKLPLEVLSDADFNRLTRGQPGATALITEGGRTRLVIREGADPTMLRAQGERLSRSVVLDASGRPIEAGRALPIDLRNRVPVNIDPDLPGNTVRVHYDIDPRTGLVTNIRMRLGPTATAVDIQLHTQTVRLMRRYAGFSGRVRNLLDRITSWIGRYGEPPVGSRAWEARLEVEKLPRIIEERMGRLSQGDLDLREQARLLDEIEDLRRQYDRHARTLADMETDPGRGFVAAEGRRPEDIATAVDRTRQRLTDLEQVAAKAQAEAEAVHNAVRTQGQTLRKDAQDFEQLAQSFDADAAAKHAEAQQQQALADLRRTEGRMDEAASAEQRARNARQAALEAEQDARASRMEANRQLSEAQALDEQLAQARSRVERTTQDVQTTRKNLERQRNLLQEIDALKSEEDKILNSQRIMGMRNPQRSEPPMDSPDGRKLKLIREEINRKFTALENEISASRGMTKERAESLRKLTPFKGEGGAEERRKFLENLPERDRGKEGKVKDWVTEEEIDPDSDEFSIDHIYPVRKILNEDGIGELPDSQIQEILDNPKNLAPMQLSLNESRGDRSISSWLDSSAPLAPKLKRETRDEAKARETEATRVVRDDIRRRVKAWRNR